MMDILSEANLSDDLALQLHVAMDDAELARIGEFLIGSLDADVYLRIQLDRQAAPNRLAGRVLDECPEELSAKNFHRITRILGASPEEVADILASTRRHRPRRRRRCDPT